MSTISLGLPGEKGEKGNPGVGTQGPRGPPGSTGKVIVFEVSGLDHSYPRAKQPRPAWLCPPLLRFKQLKNKYFRHLNCHNVFTMSYDVVMCHVMVSSLHKYFPFPCDKLLLQNLLFKCFNYFFQR